MSRSAPFIALADGPEIVLVNRSQSYAPTRIARTGDPVQGLAWDASGKLLAVRDKRRTEIWRVLATEVASVAVESLVEQSASPAIAIAWQPTDGVLAIVSAKGIECIRVLPSKTAARAEPGDVCERFAMCEYEIGTKASAVWHENPLSLSVGCNSSVLTFGWHDGVFALQATHAVGRNVREIAASRAHGALLISCDAPLHTVSATADLLAIESKRLCADGYSQRLDAESTIRPKGRSSSPIGLNDLLGASAFAISPSGSGPIVLDVSKARTDVPPLLRSAEPHGHLEALMNIACADAPARAVDTNASDQSHAHAEILSIDQQGECKSVHVLRGLRTPDIVCTNHQGTVLLTGAPLVAISPVCVCVFYQTKSRDTTP